MSSRALAAHLCVRKFDYAHTCHRRCRISWLSPHRPTVGGGPHRSSASIISRTGDRDNIAHLASQPRFHFDERDICQPFDPGPVDYVFNFASPASPPEYLRLGIETLRVGSAGVENTLEIAAKYGAGFLHASTSECYGDPLRASADRETIGAMSTRWAPARFTTRPSATPRRW